MGLQTCFLLGIDRTRDPPITPEIDEVRIRRVLEMTSSTTDFSTLLEAMHAGPKTRGQDHNQYKFGDGSSGDVYRCVLLAIRADPPALSLRYDQIISRTRQVCTSTVPVGSSVSEALLQMGKLSETVQPGSKIIEWDGDVLDIADPYFLYYLRCSARLGKIRSPGVS